MRNLEFFIARKEECICPECKSLHYFAETITEEDPFGLIQESSTRSRMPCSLK